MSLSRTVVQAPNGAPESPAQLQISALPPSRIVSVLGETDRWVPYDDGLAVARRWKLPEENIL